MRAKFLVVTAVVYNLEHEEEPDSNCIRITALLRLPVSNYNMRACLAFVVLPWLLIGAAVCQANHHAQDAGTAVERAKNAIISSFDPALPSLTLKSFLNYETDGAVVEWRLMDCDAKGTPPQRAGKNKKMCVDIYSDLDRSRTIDLVVEIPFRQFDPPELLSVSIIENGLEHPLKLIELPVALHGGRRYKTRVPRDVLPLQRVG